MPNRKSKTRCIGILTSGGDCPGLNAAIRGVVKPAINTYGMQVIGILDGFRGLVENRTIPLDDRAVSGLLIEGGTLLGTSRDKPHKMPVGGKTMDMTAAAVENARRLQIDCLVCLGGGGTQKNALHLHQEGGLNVLTLPKTIDNDVGETDVTFGFDTAMTIATEAIDRLHTTATSHHRIIVCEIMGHNAGWLPLGAGIAGGADVILIPEIPYDLKVVADHLIERRRSGKRFSIIAVAEGAVSTKEAAIREEAAKEKEERKQAKKEGKKRKKEAGRKSRKGGKEGRKPLAQVEEDLSESRRPLNTVILRHEGREVAVTYRKVEEPMSSRLARQLQEITGMEARVTNLGHIQRGGIPSATDRLLSTRLGTKAAQLLADGVYNVMVAVKGEECEAIPLQEVAGKRKVVPLDHNWIDCARLVGSCLGDE